MATGRRRNLLSPSVRGAGFWDLPRVKRSRAQDRKWQLAGNKPARRRRRPCWLMAQFATDSCGFWPESSALANCTVLLLAVREVESRSRPSFGDRLKLNIRTGRWSEGGI